LHQWLNINANGAVAPHDDLAAIAAHTAIHVLAGSSVRLGLENRGAIRSLHEAESTPDPHPVALNFSGEPVPYSWGPEFATTLTEDAARYEVELSALLESPLSVWERIPKVHNQYLSNHTSDALELVCYIL
jgi:hypothetical protein